MSYSKIKFAAGALLVIGCLLPTIALKAQGKSMADYIAGAPFRMSAVVLPTIPASSFNIKDYGAVADGQFLNTDAFAKAINACTRAGGGTVVVPAGLWLTGPIQLQSNLRLEVQAGALIQFTADHTQYPIIRASSKSSSYVVASPLYGYDLKNIAITGEGVIDGAGESWRPVKKSKVTAAQWKAFTATGVLSNDGAIWWPNQQAIDGEALLKTLKDASPKPGPEAYLPAREFLRPYMVYLVNCERVLVEGVTIRNSPKFVFYPNTCRDVTMNRVNIFNESWAQNGDAIDISACKNVMIYQCNVSAGDDGICLKSSGGKDGIDTSKASLENVVVAGCKVYRAHGGFVIGSNTDGNMRNVYVIDCSFIGSDVGIRVKSNAGRGGLVKDIYIDNISMSDIAHEAVLFDTYYEDVTAGKKATAPSAEGDKIPQFRDFYIKNVFCKGAEKAIAITGLPQMPVRRIHFEHVTIEAREGYIGKDVAEIDFKNVTLITKTGTVTPR